MKKSSRIILYIVFGSIFIAGIWMIRNRILKDRDRIRVYRPKSEPKFRNDGQLLFLNPDEEDTIQIIDIEIVEDTEDIVRGMMFRSTLDEMAGMLFIFPDEEEHTFWMKNTQISLDIIFVDKDFRIVKIADHRVPFSTDPINSSKPVQYVVEVNAGFCKKYGIIPGNEIKYFKNDM